MKRSDLLLIVGNLFALAVLMEGVGVWDGLRLWLAFAAVTFVICLMGSNKRSKE